MQIYLIRHGETSYNEQKLFQGHMDISLNEIGRKQAEAWIPLFTQLSLNKIYCSDLLRAYETAQIINSKMNLPIIKTTQLRELHLGDYEGKSFQAIEEFNKTHKPPHAQFPNGESYDMMFTRVNKEFEKITKTETTDSVLLVTHGGPLRSIISSILGINYFEKKPVQFDNAGLTWIEFKQNHYRIKSLNIPVEILNGHLSQNQIHPGA